MIRSIWQRFLTFPVWLKIVWLLCLIGLIMNSWTLGRDMYSSSILFRLHIGFWVLYAGQVVFILWGEKMVWVLSLMQAMLALFSNYDFTFVPVVRMLGNAIYGVYGNFSVEEVEIYKYVFVSMCFTLELLKTALLFLYRPPQAQAS